MGGGVLLPSTGIIDDVRRTKEGADRGDSRGITVAAGEALVGRGGCGIRGRGWALRVEFHCLVWYPPADEDREKEFIMVGACSVWLFSRSLVHRARHPLGEQLLQNMIRNKHLVLEKEDDMVVDFGGRALDTLMMSSSSPVGCSDRTSRRMAKPEGMSIRSRPVKT